MPRLTNEDYLRNRRQLHAVWHSSRSAVIFLLGAMEQLALHDYDRLSEKLANTEALEHRGSASRRDPSLPQRAGRALGHLHRLQPVLGTYVAARQAAPTRTKNASTKLAVFAEVRPDIDPERIASILLKMMHESIGTVSSRDR